MNEETKLLIEKALASGSHRDIYQLMNIYKDEFEKDEEDGTQRIP